jgi:hypothetical protein
MKNIGKINGINQQTWSSCSIQTWKYLYIVGKCTSATLEYIEMGRWMRNYDLFQSDVLMIHLFNTLLSSRKIIRGNYKGNEQFRGVSMHIKEWFAHHEVLLHNTHF